MKKRTLNILGVMLLSAMASLMASAQATQNHPPQPQTAKPEVARAGNGAGTRTDGISVDASVSPDLATGWNYIHATNCELFYSGGYPYLYVYGNGYYFWTTSSAFQTLIEPACQTGNWLAFYVYNSSGAWSEVYTYTYK